MRAISGREGELWHPLLAIAKFLDINGCDGLFERIKKVAVKKGEEAKSTGIDDWTNALLLGLKEITRYKEDGITTSEMKEAMNKYLEDEARPSSRWIGQVIKRLGLGEGKKSHGKYKYTIENKTVKDVIERYGV